LVVNEALQAGCAVTLSDAVGCGAEFAGLRHCRVFTENDARGLAESLALLADDLPGDRGWARDFMGGYSTEAAARAIAEAMDRMAAGGKASV